MKNVARYCGFALLCLVATICIQALSWSTHGIAAGFNQNSAKPVQQLLSFSGDVKEAWVTQFSLGKRLFLSGYPGIVMAIDRARNIYVTGSIESATAGYDYITLKFTAEGVLEWSARYDGPAHRDDWALANAVDDAGNVYVTGTSMESRTGYNASDCATVKYNASGVMQWAASYNAPGISGDIAEDLTLDGLGNVCITGSSVIYDSLRHTPKEEDYLTIKYNASGAEQWVVKHNGGANLFDYAFKVAVDATGNIYVAGETDYNYFIQGITQKVFYTTVKYNAEGVQQWVVNTNQHNSAGGPLTGFVLDGQNNVYLAGAKMGINLQADFLTIKYNGDGVEQWRASYASPDNKSDYITDLAVDGSGNVYVTGSSGKLSDNAFVTIKYNSSGVEQWHTRYRGSGNLNDNPSAVVVDGSGGVYVTGSSFIWSSTTGTNYATVKYTTDGVEEWVALYTSPQKTDYIATGLVVDDRGRVYVTGRTNESQGSFATTIKYIQNPVSVEEKKPAQPSTCWLAQSYPNPFNPVTKIRYSLPSAQDVTLKVYDLHGKEIATLVNARQAAGEHSLNFDASRFASGVYFYKLTAGAFNETKKMLFVK